MRRTTKRGWTKHPNGSPRRLAFKIARYFDMTIKDIFIYEE